MTRSDIFIQILSEVSEKPKEQVADLLVAFRKMVPGSERFDEQMPDAEAEKMLSGLREQKEGIRAWLNSGFLQVLLRASPPHGHA